MNSLHVLIVMSFLFIQMPSALSIEVEKNLDKPTTAAKDTKNLTSSQPTKPSDEQAKVDDPDEVKQALIKLFDKK